MKRCFTFNDYAECKRLVKHLKTVIPSTIHIQIGNTITVYEDVYETAITEGKKYAIANNISCNWIDAAGHELPLSLIPFACLVSNHDISITAHCLSSSIFSSITSFISMCENILEQKCFIQIEQNGNVIILIEKNYSIEAQNKIINNIKENTCSYTLNSVIFTDNFGNANSIITLERSNQ